MHCEILAQTLLLVLVVLQCICSVYSNEETFTFDVKPGGETHKYDAKYDGISCSFEYSAQGGTNELWAMTIGKQTESMYTCDVFRPEKDSYLMFEKFDLNIKGAKLKDAVLFINKDLKDANPGEYEKDVSSGSVKTTSQFKNKLHRVIAQVTTNQKEDL